MIGEEEYVISNTQRIATHANVDDTVTHWTLKLRDGGKGNLKGWNACFIGWGKEKSLLINVSEIEVKPFWKRWLCVHKFTGGVRTVYDNKGKKRHAYICLKCGKRDYID